MTHFGFLQREWPDVHEAASKAAAGAYPDPRTACFYARRARSRSRSRGPTSTTPRSSSRTRTTSPRSSTSRVFKQTAGEAVFSKARHHVVRQPRRPQPPRHSCRRRRCRRARAVPRHLLVRAYVRPRPAPGLAFDANALPRTAPVPRQTTEQLQLLETTLRERDEHLATLLATDPRSTRS
jgi:type I restriction enzyme, R subunit